MQAAPELFPVIFMLKDPFTSVQAKGAAPSM
jgi:hypothetical protein